MHINMKRMVVATLLLASGLIAATERKSFEKDNCTVTIPAGWEWDSEKPKGAFRCRAFNRLRDLAFTFQILEGGGKIDEAFGRDMDSQFSGMFEKKLSSRFLDTKNGRCYQHTFLGKRGDVCVIRHCIANQKLYALSLVGPASDVQNQKLIEETMAFLKIVRKEPKSPSVPKSQVSNYDVYMPFASGSIVVLFWWVCILVSMLKWLKRMVTYKPRRLYPGVKLFGALRNQLVFFCLLVMSGIIGSFAGYADSRDNLRVESFIQDSSLFFASGLVVLLVLLGIAIKRAGRSDLSKMGKVGLIALLIVPLDIVLAFVLLHKVLYS